MRGLKLPRVKEGQPIDECREQINAILDAIEDLEIVVPPGSGMVRKGNTLVSTRKRGMFIKLTAASGTGLTTLYSWTEQVWSGSAFVDGAHTGTSTSNPARRANGTAALTLPVTVWAWQEVGAMVFPVSDC